MSKKKYHGGLKVLLFVLFIMLLGLFSTSYASNLTPINQLTPEILRLFIDELHNNQAFLLKSSTVYNNYNSFYSSFTDQNLSDFCTSWNNTDFSNYADYLEQCLFLISYDGTTPSLAVVFSNNNIGNKSLHTQYLLNSNTNVYVYSIDDNINKIASLKYNINFNGAGTLSLTSSSYPTTGFNYKFIDITNTFYYLNDTAFETPMIYCYGRPHSIYINIPTKTDGYKWSLLSGNSVLVLSSPVVPDIPSGDTSTGTITNPSGDIIGQIDLSGIEQGIGDINNNLNNIENKIPTSGDITSATINANNNYWGNPDEIDTDDFTGEISNNVNNLMSSLSGDLSNNEAFASLEQAENGFLDLFRNHEEETAYDLKFEWDDFSPVFTMSNGSSVNNSIPLIKKGSINISQMCRDNEKLAYLQSLIRIIFNFTVIMSLIYQVWNLILATLGIDNPYLYENYSEVEKINLGTGEVHETAYKRHRVFSFKRKGG